VITEVIYISDTTGAVVKVRGFKDDTQPRMIGRCGRIVAPAGELRASRQR
jgi:hypothetical protein